MKKQKRPKEKRPVELVKSTRIVVSDGKRLPPLGSELFHANQLFMRLRGVGVSEEDIRRINNQMDDTYFECLLAMSLGLTEIKFPQNIANLQVCGWLGFPSRDNLTVIRDNRLGMQIFRQEGNSLILGDMKIAAVNAFGNCVSDGGKTYNDESLKLQGDKDVLKNYVHLTHAAAEWISYDHPEIARAMLQGNEQSQVVFLGTVWRVLENQYKPNEAMSPISATAIWLENDPQKDYHKTGVRHERMVLPQGEWPDDLLVAVLV